MGAVIVLALLAAPGEAAGTAASFNPDPLDFGNVQSGSALGYVTATNESSSARTFRDTVINLGAGFTTDNNLAATTGRDQACYFNGPSDVVQVQVAPGGTCRLYYRFTPGSDGSFSAQPLIQVQDPLSSASEVDPIVLRASSYTPDPATRGAFTLSPASLAFGTVPVGQTKSLSTTLTNTSDGNVQVHTAYPAGSQYRTDPTSTCTQTGGPAVVLVPDATCTIVVTFTPVLDGASNISTSISLTPASGAPGTTVPYESNTRLVSKSLPLRGTGVGAKFSLSPRSLSFGTVSTYGYKSLPLTVKNTSTGPLEFGASFGSVASFQVILPETQSPTNCLWGETVGSGFPGDPQVVEPRSQVIASGATCVISVLFHPFAAGELSATIPIRSYGASGAVGGWQDTSGSTVTGGASVKATGTAAEPTFTLSKSSLAFGDVTVTDVKRLEVTMKNTSTIPLQFGSDVASDYTFRPVPSDAANSCMSEELVPPQDWDDPPFGTLVRQYRSVPAGGSCVLTFGFFTYELGTASFSLPVQVYRAPGAGGFMDSGAPLATRQIPATGTGVAPTLQFSPSTLAFGKRTVSSAKSVVVTIKNTSPVPLQLGSSQPTDGGTYRAVLPTGDTGSNCMRGTYVPDPNPFLPPHLVYEYRIVGASQSCSMSFVYYPSALGETSAQIPITYYRSYQPSSTFSDAGFSLGSTSIKATGTAVAPTFSFSPSKVAFGDVTVGGTRTVEVTVKNTSDAYLAFDTTYSTQGSPYRFVMPQDGPQGASCVYETYQPPQFPGDPGLTETHYRTVAPDATCVLTFALSPTATGAAPDATFPVQVYEAYNLPGSYSTSVGQQRASGALKATGSGVASTFTLTPATLAYRTVSIGSSKTLTTVIKNTSKSPAAYDIAITNSAYRVAFATDHDPADCISRTGSQTTYVTVAAGASCDLRIEFLPSTLGSANASFTVNAYAPYALPGFYSENHGPDVIGSKVLKLTAKGR
ncbi:choice-of-anchor D domain-containing protein [Nocardioides humilatus]|uniref:choice-of-anchor D domain-containing protein n=1 Tax=Nocardioides humilatus TaxID=2607660 RepID=UPI00165EBFE3|nr:choice-of-anchor D domain-containing protein [Nocardioides humilatus]